MKLWQVWDVRIEQRKERQFWNTQCDPKVLRLIFFLNWRHIRKTHTFFSPPPHTHTHTHTHKKKLHWHIYRLLHSHTPPDGATARGGPWPLLQYASRSLVSLLYLSIRLHPSFSGPWTRHPAISFLVFLFVLLHTAFRTASFLGLFAQSYSFWKAVENSSFWAFFN